MHRSWNGKPEIEAPDPAVKTAPVELSSNPIYRYQGREEPELLTVEEVSEKLRLSVKWIRRYSSRIPGKVKCAGSVRYLSGAINAAIASGKILMD